MRSNSEKKVYDRGGGIHMERSLFLREKRGLGTPMALNLSGAYI